jgi:predicted ATPase
VIGNALGVERSIRSLLQDVVKQQTQWCIITGAPCSGKTTVLRALGNLGFRTNPDLSRQYFAEMAVKGFDTESLRASGEQLHQELFRRMLLNAMQLPPGELIFHDYGLPDNIAFRIEDGLDDDPDLNLCCDLIQYWKVFLLAPAPFQQDEHRVEEDSYQLRIVTTFRTVYRSLGYIPIEIPLLSTPERCTMILDALGGELTTGVATAIEQLAYLANRGIG